MNKKDGRFLAYMTLEATYVTIFMLLFLLLLIFCGIILHDICCLYARAQYEANEAAKELSQTVFDGHIDWVEFEQSVFEQKVEKKFQRKKEAFNMRLSENVMDGLLFVKKIIPFISYHPDEDGKNIVMVSYLFTLRLPLGYISRRYLQEYYFQLHVFAKAEVFSSDLLLRKLSSVFHALKNLED